MKAKYIVWVRPYASSQYFVPRYCEDELAVARLVCENEDAIVTRILNARVTAVLTDAEVQIDVAEAEAA